MDEADWADIRRNANSGVQPPEDWPPGVKPISMAGASLFGIDGRDRLYWDGRPLAYKVKLSAFQNFLVIIGALGAFLSGFTDALEYLNIKW